MSSSFDLNPFIGRHTLTFMFISTNSFTDFFCLTRFWSDLMSSGSLFNNLTAWLMKPSCVMFNLHTGTIRKSDCLPNLGFLIIILYKYFGFWKRSMRSPNLIMCIAAIWCTHREPVIQSRSAVGRSILMLLFFPRKKRVCLWHDCNFIIALFGHDNLLSS